VGSLDGLVFRFRFINHATMASTIASAIPNGTPTYTPILSFDDEDEDEDDDEGGALCEDCAGPLPVTTEMEFVSAGVDVAATRND
jgi:hypothetical protein